MKKLTAFQNRGSSCFSTKVANLPKWPQGNARHSLWDEENYRTICSLCRWVFFSTCPHLQIDLKVPKEEVMDLPKYDFRINFGESPEND